MDRQTRRTPHAHPAPSFNASTRLRQSARRLRASLLPLESALIAAEKMTPSRAPRPLLDLDEALAVRLIENIKRQQPAFFPAMQVESPRPFHREAILEMAGRDV